MGAKRGTGRGLQLFVTSAMAGSAEAHSQIAPPKNYLPGLFGDHFLSHEEDAYFAAAVAFAPFPCSAARPPQARAKRRPCRRPGRVGRRFGDREIPGAWCLPSVAPLRAHQRRPQAWRRSPRRPPGSRGAPLRRWFVLSWLPLPRFCWLCRCAPPCGPSSRSFGQAFSKSASEPPSAFHARRSDSLSILSRFASRSFLAFSSCSLQPARSWRKSRGS
jgi:hypothetical protein